MASNLFSFHDEDHAMQTFNTSLDSTLKYAKCKTCLLHAHKKFNDIIMANE